ncbi:MAG: hypothetical protein MK135_06670 [Polyangiaceae bacterium]|nr:hypothetical protein [Polyangiaceae bacterium]
MYRLSKPRLGLLLFLLFSLLLHGSLGSLVFYAERRLPRRTPPLEPSEPGLAFSGHLIEVAASDEKESASAPSSSSEATSAASPLVNGETPERAASDLEQAPSKNRSPSSSEGDEQDETRPEKEPSESKVGHSDEASSKILTPDRQPLPSADSSASAAAQPSTDSSASAASQAPAGSFGAADVRAGRLDLRAAFIKTLPLAAKPDNEWLQLEPGRTGSCTVQLTVGENGTLEKSEAQPGAGVLARTVRRNHFYLRHSRFRISAEGRGVAVLKLSYQVQQKEPSLEYEPTSPDLVAGLGMRLQAKGPPRGAYLTFLSGRHIEFSIVLLPSVE